MLLIEHDFQKIISRDIAELTGKSTRVSSQSNNQGILNVNNRYMQYLQFYSNNKAWVICLCLHFCVVKVQVLQHLRLLQNMHAIS